MKDSSYWRTVLCVFIGITVAGNTGHVLLVGAEHPIPAAALAAVPPLALVLITHGLTGRIGRGGGAVFWIGAAGAFAVAGGAFWISWVTLRDLTAQLLNCGPAVASVMPLIIDVTIAVASAMAVAAHRRELVHAHQESVAQVLTAAPVTVPAAVPVSMSTAPAVQQSDAQLSTGDAQVQHIGAQVLTAPEPAQEPAADTAHFPAQEAAASGDAPDTTAQSDEFPAQRAEANTAQSGRVLALVHKGGAQPATGAQVSDEQPMRTAQQPDEQGAQLDPAVEATRLIERGSSRLDEEKLTDVIGRIARGESHNSIATTTGISRNTVMRLAGMVPTEPDDSDDEASA